MRDFPEMGGILVMGGWFSNGGGGGWYPFTDYVQVWIFQFGEQRALCEMKPWGLVRVKKDILLIQAQVGCFGLETNLVVSIWAEHWSWMGQKIKLPKNSVKSLTKISHAGPTWDFCTTNFKGSFI